MRVKRDMRSETSSAAAKMISGLKLNGCSDSIMKYVLKSKRAAISACWRDSDGYWITLKNGYNAGRMDNGGCHTIHEDTIADLRYQIAGIETDPYEMPDEA